MITNPIEMAASAAVIVVCSAMSGRLAFLFADAVHEAPEWLKLLSGSVGAIACMAYGIRWFTKQLEEAKAESKKDKEALVSLVKEVTTQVTLSTVAIKDSTLAVNRDVELHKEVLDKLEQLK